MWLGERMDRLRARTSVLALVEGWSGSVERDGGSEKGARGLQAPRGWLESVCAKSSCGLTAGGHVCGQSSVQRTMNQSQVGSEGTSTGLDARQLSSDFCLRFSWSLSFPPTSACQNRIPHLVCGEV